MTPKSKKLICTKLGQRDVRFKPEDTGTRVRKCRRGRAVTICREDECTHPVKAADLINKVRDWFCLASPRSGVLLAFGLPVPGQELVEPLGRMILQTRQDVSEPHLLEYSAGRISLDI